MSQDVQGSAQAEKLRLCLEKNRVKLQELKSALSKKETKVADQRS